MELNLYDYYGFLEKKDSLRIFIVKVRKYQKIFFSCLQFLQKEPTQTFPQYSSYIQLKSVGFLKELKNMKKNNLMRLLDL